MESHLLGAGHMSARRLGRLSTLEPPSHVSTRFTQSPAMMFHFGTNLSSVFCRRHQPGRLCEGWRLGASSMPSFATSV